MHPPWDRRQALAAVGLAMTAPWARAQPTPLPERLAAVWPEAGPLRLPFTVVAEPESRLVFTLLRSTVPVASVTLLDPAQRVAWRTSGAALAARDRRTLQRPELGEAYSLPPLRDAVSGRWTLVLERPGPQRGTGTAEVALSVLPRFQLFIVTETPEAAAGQPVLVSVRPTDHGEPVAGLPGIELRVQGTHPVPALRAVEALRTRDGLRLSDERGVYRAFLTVAEPGRYSLEATHSFQGRQGPVLRSAQRALDVAASRGNLALAGVRTVAGPGGCTKTLLLDFDVQAAAPGLHACNLTLRADATPVRAAASAELAAGPGRITVAVDAARLAALGPGWRRVDRAVLLVMAGNDLRVAAERVDIDLAPFDAAAAPPCR